MSGLVTFEYKPLPIFVPFHQSRERSRLIVGGFGSGKSHALCAEGIALGLEQPGLETLVTRKTVPALKATTEKIFLSLLPPEFLAQCEVRKAGGHLDTIVFPNGSTYLFRGMDDWRKLRSLNLGLIVWDEFDEYTVEDFEGMQSRVRQTRPVKAATQQGFTAPITRRGNIMAMNPAGHNFAYELFVDPETRKPSTAYFVSTSFDNPFLPKDTLDDWLRMPEPWIRRFVLASFDEFAGAIYPDWAFDTHIIPPLKNYDTDAFFRMGYDPGSGSSDPMAPNKGSLNAAVWVYHDKKTGRLIAIAEYAEGGLNVTQHAQAWRRIEAQHGMRQVTRIGDPKAVTQRDRGSNVKLSDMYARKGFHFQLGPSSVNDRVWSLGELITTGRFVATEDCPRLHAQLLAYRWEDLTPTQVEKGKEARPLKKDVDLVDAAQYAVSRYTPPPKITVPKDPDDAHAQQIHTNIRRQLARNRTRNAKSSNPLGSVYR